MSRSALVTATYDRHTMLRMKRPGVVTTIAEYFSGQECDVLLMIDSLIWFAMAQREIRKVLLLVSTPYW